MTRVLFAGAAIGAFALAGCVGAPQSASLPTSPVTQPPRPVVVETSYEEGTPIVSADTAPNPMPDLETIDRPKHSVGHPLTLEALETMALANNPAIGEADARVRVLRGKWIQVGLPPNPTAGYSASEIGNDGAAGQQGGYVGQTYVTAHKLGKNRAVVAAEINRAEQQLAATERRVRTDVRNAYYLTLVAQRRVELAEVLLEVNSNAVTTSRALVDAEELSAAGLLQTEIRQENAQVLLQTARNSQQQAWRKLGAVIGDVELPAQDLQGDVTILPDLLDWQEELSRLHAESPEIAAAIAEIQRARRALDRANVQAVPNVTTELSVQYDNATEYTIAGVQLGMPIPLWNRNQGGIRQAMGEIAAAERSAERVELSLTNRLADAFQGYVNAHVTASRYSTDILPRAEQTLNLVRQAYEHGELGYLDFLAAQQTYSQTNLDYLSALEQAWQSYVLIDGLLLDGSLEATVVP